MNEHLQEWIHEGRPPFDDYTHIFEVWDGKRVRRCCRIWNQSRSTTPGTLLYTDCTHPAQNALVAEREIQAWRIAGGLQC